MSCFLDFVPFLFPCFASGCCSSYYGDSGLDTERVYGSRANFLLAEKGIFWERVVWEVGNSLEGQLFTFGDFGCDGGDLGNVSHRWSDFFCV